MIKIEFKNLKNLNISVQTGDAVFARNTTNVPAGLDVMVDNFPSGPSSFLPTGKNHYVGILKQIDDKGNGNYDFYVDENDLSYPNKDRTELVPYLPLADDFIMFSKFTQGDSGLLGYYAEAKFKNDSREKAELYAVSSEIIINSN